MDSKSIIMSLRTMNMLNLVVSTEPVDIAHLLSGVLGRGPLKRGMVRAVTRFGIMDIRAYLRGDSLIGPNNTSTQPKRQKTEAETLAATLADRTTHEQWEGLLAAAEKLLKPT